MAAENEPKEVRAALPDLDEPMPAEMRAPEGESLRLLRQTPVPLGIIAAVTFVGAGLRQGLLSAVGRPPGEPDGRVLRLPRVARQRIDALAHRHAANLERPPRLSPGASRTRRPACER
jgi:hypothetical protein